MAALITAISGLILGLYQYGVFGPKKVPVTTPAAAAENQPVRQPEQSRARMPTQSKVKQLRRDKSPSGPQIAQAPAESNSSPQWLTGFWEWDTGESIGGDCPLAVHHKWTFSSTDSTFLRADGAEYRKGGNDYSCDEWNCVHPFKAKFKYAANSDSIRFTAELQPFGLETIKPLSCRARGFPDESFSGVISKNSESEITVKVDGGPVVTLSRK